MDNLTVGMIGERLLFNRLRNMGRVSVPKVRLVGDIHLDGVRIEAKASMPTHVNSNKIGWQFCLRRGKNTDISHSHVLVLLCLDYDGSPVRVYIIPVSALRADRKKIAIVRGSTTKWAYWENRFDVIESALHELVGKVRDGVDAGAVRGIWDD